MKINDVRSILSIDFDYFQDVTPEILTEYPDGIDISSELSAVIWGSKYCFSKRNLLEIKPLSEEIFLLMELLKKQDPQTKILISQSHRDIYEWIHNNVSLGEQLKLINIDMHHDMFNDNKKIDCGNWVTFIMDEYGRENIYFRWIANPVSFKMYGFEKDEEESSKFHSYIGTSINDVENDKFDMIFLCRSDAWLPPHLDKEFSNIVNLIKSQFYNGKIQSVVSRPRDYQRYISQFKEKTDQIMV